MKVRRWSVVTVVIGWVLVAASSASIAWAAEPTFSAPKAVTLVVGDSLAFGFQRAKFLAGLPAPNPASFNTGFADVFEARLVATPPGGRSTLVNLGCPGETTATFLVGRCPYTQAGFHLHIDYAGSQMAAAMTTLDANHGQVSPILISLGANDLLSLVNLCGINAACIAPLLPGVLAAVAQNYQAVLATLRTTAPDAEIIVLGLYNPFAALDPSTNSLTLALNNLIASVAAANQARVADAFPAFNLALPQPTTLCTLTLFCQFGDIHASDAGYAVIGNLLFEAAGYTRFEH